MAKIFIKLKCNLPSLMFYNFQFCSVAQSCPTLCNPMDCSTPDFPVHHQLPGLAQTHVHWVGDAIKPSHPLLSPSPPTFNLSQHQGLFWWVSSSHEVVKVLQLQLQHESFQWIFRPDSFRMDWFDLLAVQGTLKTLLQHHNSKASILRRSAFFIVQLSQPYITTGKTIALTRQTFVSKVMSLLFFFVSAFYMLFRFVHLSPCLLSCSLVSCAGLFGGWVSEYNGRKGNGWDQYHSYYGIKAAFFASQSALGIP